MIEDPAAMDVLLDAIEDEDEEVQKQAMWALTRVMRTSDLSAANRSELAERLRRALGRDPMLR